MCRLPRWGEVSVVGGGSARGSRYFQGMENRLQSAVRSAYHASLQAMPLRLRRTILFAKAHHVLPRTRTPRTFSEKLNWRMLNDRRDILAGTCDKLQMKELARERAGDLVRVPETFWHGDDLRTLADAALPDRWVLKPTHRSQCVYFGEGRPDVQELEARTAGWLDEINWSVYGEWAYSLASRQFFVEEVLGRPGSPPPDDYKIAVFDGKPRLVQVDQGRFSAGHARRFYTPDWEPLPHRNPDAVLAPVTPPPAGLAQMLSAAAAIAAGFDFLRVDFYLVDGVLWFGETTPYDGGGLTPYQPADLDLTLGSWWQLPVGV